ncbi:Ig-like domain-containing protein, partial [Methylobacterium planeticum]
AFSVTPGTALGDGPYAFTATATDAAGNLGAPSAPVSLTIDTAVPAAPVVTSAGGATSDTTPAITGTGEAGATVTLLDGTAPVGTATVGQNGGFTVSPGAPLGEGPHNLSVQLTDAAGNVGAPSPAVAVTIDSLAPTIPVVTGGGGATADTTPAVTGTAEPGATVTLLNGTTALGTATVNPDGSFTVSPTTPLGQGTYDLSVRVTDAAGNTSPVTAAIGVTVDTTLPTTPTLTAPAGPTSDSTPTLTGTAEANSTVTIANGNTVLGTVTADSGGAFSFTPVPAFGDGTYALTATVRDAAGNVGAPSAPVSLTIDTAAPVMPVLTSAGGPTSSAAPAITGTGEIGARVTLLDGTAPVGTAIVDQDGSFTVSPGAPLGEGPHNLSVQLTDAAGNVGAPSMAITVTVDVTAPAAPVFTTASGVTADATPAIAGTAEAGATVTVFDDGTPLGTVQANARGAWSFTPGTALANGPNLITATATDAVGNISPAATGPTLTVDTGAPPAPVLTIAPGPTNDNTPTITGTAEANSTVTITSGGILIATVTADAGGAFSVTPGTALGDGPYAFTATATDAAGNLGAPSAPVSLTIDTAVPAAPVVTSAGGATSDTTPAITGTGEAGATVTLLDGTAPVGTATVGQNGGFTVSPGAPLGEGPHNLSVHLTDAAGNVGAPSPAVAVTVDTNVDVPPALAFTVATTADGRLNATEAQATAFTIAGLDAGTTGTATFTDASTASVSVAIGANGTYAADLSGLDGPVTTSLRVTDPAGNAGTIAGPSLTLDTLAPVGTAVADASGGPEVASFTYTVSFPEAVANVGAEDFTLTGTNGATGTIAGVTGSGGTYTVTVAEVSGAGTLSLGLAAGSDITDLAGNAASLTPADRAVIGVAPVLPVITGYTIDTGVPSDGITGDPTPTLTGIGAAGSTVTVTYATAAGPAQATGTVLADGTWSLTLPTLADGDYSFTASLATAGGTPIGTSAPLALTIDTGVDAGTPTTLVVDGTADGLINAAEATAVAYTVAGLDAGTSGTITFRDGIRATEVAVSQNGTFAVDLSGFSGPVSANLALRDVAGNAATLAGNTVSLATGAPGAPVITGLADDTGTLGDTLTADTNPTLSGLADPGSAIRLDFTTAAGPQFVETVAGASGAWTATLPLLPDGAYAVTASARDAAGNASVASAPFPISIDATAPAGTAGADTAGGLTAETFTYTVSFPEAVANVGAEDFSLTGTNGATGTIAGVTGSGGTYTVTVAGVSGAGTLSLGLAAGSDIADRAGNLASLTPATRNVAVGPDATVPTTISGFTEDSGVAGDGITSDATPTLTGTGNAGGTVTVTFATAAGAQTLTGPVDALGNWTVPVPELADGRYSFTATTSGPSGAPGGTSAPLALTIDTVADALPAVALALDGSADGVLTPAEAATARFTLSGLDAGSGAAVTFTDAAGTRVAATASADGTYTVDLSGLIGPVTSSVVVTDAAGNSAVGSGNPIVIDAGTTTPPRTPVPTITGIQEDTGTPGDGITSDASPILVGTASPGSTVTVSYTGAAGGAATATGTVGTDGAWQIALPALADGSYSFVATALAPGSTSSPASQALPVVIDTVVPAAPVFGGIVGDDGDGVVTDASPTLTGTAEPGSTVTVTYETPQGPGSATGTTGTDGRWTVDIPTLPDGSYSLTVGTTDAAGNAGAPAAPVSLTINTGTGGGGTGGGGTGGGGTGGGSTGGGGTGGDGGTGGSGGSGGSGGTAPVLVGDLNQTLAHAPAVSGNLLANDTGAALKVTAVQFSGGLPVAVPTEGTVKVVSDHGTLTVSADGSYSYQAIGANNLDDTVRTAEHFTYTVTDAAGAVGQSSLDISLGGQAPQASASFGFAFTEARVTLAGEALVLVGPDGVTRDISGIDTLRFTDGEIQNNDGHHVVDDVFYYANNLDVWRAHVDADTHYETFGWKEGRDPNAYFHTRAYLAENPDVAAANINPLEHYLTFGEREGRSPSPGFSAEAYLHANPDVAAAGINALAHYLTNGQDEGRTVFAGESEGPGRVIGDFDADFYLAQYADVAAAVPAGREAASYALEHYLTFGARELRNPNAAFDTAYYLQQNPEVAASGANPLLHYQEVGWHEGRNPSASFNTNAYLASHPEVAQAGIDPLEHYLQTGGHALA